MSGAIDAKRVATVLREIRSRANASACAMFDKRGFLVTRPVGEGQDLGKLLGFSIVSSLMTDKLSGEMGVGSLRMLVVDVGDHVVFTRKILWNRSSEYYVTLLMGSDAPVGLAIIETENLEKMLGSLREPEKEKRSMAGGIEPELESIMNKLEQHPLFKALVSSRGEAAGES